MYYIDILSFYYSMSDLPYINKIAKHWLANILLIDPKVNITIKYLVISLVKHSETIILHNVTNILK